MVCRFRLEKTSLPVYHIAMRIAAEELNCDQEIVALSALLHDADDYKLFRTENNANARSFLKEQCVSEERTERICVVIRELDFHSENQYHGS